MRNMNDDTVKVAVRVRPLNNREITLSAKCIVEMTKDQTILLDPRHATANSPQSSGDKKHRKIFAFDHCFWSCHRKDAHFADQKCVYDSVGSGALENAFQGYNACILAYGQTGSGKSYSMMGTAEQPGVIPRLCRDLFTRIELERDLQPNASFKVEVSYMEIYNEKVYDLLGPNGAKTNLRVREHNILGPYVEGLTTAAVESFEDIEILMAEGNKARTVAATNMNNESSRSHAVFTIILTQAIEDKASGVRGEKVSRLNLVDLAGSERASKTGADGERLKEGGNINKSLSTLGLVISALAEQSSGKPVKTSFVPYRDSVLTWLLKDSLGGNSRTVMIATISPAADEYEETLSTLRYADRTKRIVNHAVVNEDPNAKLVRELREEVEMLRKELMLSKGASTPRDIEERFEESNRILENMNKPWEVKLKESEQAHEARQLAFEQMGISVHSGGIKVEKGRYYLVNLNDDPSLNENLVYYLKEHNSVGRPEAEEQQDIQLSGIGIRSLHAELVIEAQELFVIPFSDAKTCVNGEEINCKTRLFNRDRLVFGNNHFFRVNCPKTEENFDSSSPDEPVNYESAREELIRNKMNDPHMAALIQALENQYQEDKQKALMRQSHRYEQQMLMYRSSSTVNTPMAQTPGNFHGTAFGSSYDLHRGSMTPSNPYASTPTLNSSRYELWNPDREEWFSKCLTQLKMDIIKANTLAQEAKYLAKELAKETDYQVTLQIPVSNLTPSRKVYSNLSEAAIVVKRKHLPNQIWSIEKLENKLVDMRELYNLWRGPEIPSVRNTGNQLLTAMDIDPFYEHEENHNLIGVANVFMSVLFHDCQLNYSVPIISQQGEIVGRLHIEIARVAGDLSLEDREGDAGDFDSECDEYDDDYNDERDFQRRPDRREIVTKISIIEATGLPPAFANFVFCQYTFWGEKDAVIVPHIQPGNHPVHQNKEGARFKFGFTKEHSAPLNEDFIEFCQEGSLSIQVWGHKHSGKDEFAQNKLDFKSKTIADHWMEVSRKVEMNVEILELNDQGIYAPVDVHSDSRLATGGAYQLHQGQMRHLRVKVQPVAEKGGFLPVNVASIIAASIGSVDIRDLMQQRGLDSYQEADLKTLRTKWEQALKKRKQHLEEQMLKLTEKPNKSELDNERLKNLDDQFLTLTEELSSLQVPQPGSGVPGAPAHSQPPEGMETHHPVLFMGLDFDAIRTATPLADQYMIVGETTILPRESSQRMLELTLIKYDPNKEEATFTWDSSRHDSPYLNRATEPNHFVHMIVKVVVRLTHPAPVDLVLRKRIALTVQKKRVFSMSGWMQKLSGWKRSLTSTGVTYQLVSSLPEASEETEDRSQLALLACSAAATEAVDGIDGESYIDKYLRNILGVEMLLKRERDRQEIKIKDQLTRQGKPLRKTTSVPSGIGHFSRSSEIISSLRDMRPSFDAMSMSGMGPSTPTSGERKSLNALNSPLYSSTPLKPNKRMLPVMEETHIENEPAEPNSSPPSKSEPQSHLRSSNSLQSQNSDDAEAASCGSPISKTGLQNSSSLGGLSSGVGSQTNTQSSLSDAGSSSGLRSHSVSPDIDSGCHVPVERSLRDSGNSDSLNGETSLISFDNQTEELMNCPVVESEPSSTESASTLNAPEEEEVLGDNQEVVSDGLNLHDVIDSDDCASIHSSQSESFSEWLSVGKRVLLKRNHCPAEVKFVGGTSFGDGVWIGIAFDGPFGKHDGFVKGRRYFSCAEKHGLFVRHHQLAPIPPKTPTGSIAKTPVKQKAFGATTPIAEGKSFKSSMNGTSTTKAGSAAQSAKRQQRKRNA